MEYFSKFLRTSTLQQPKSEYDRVQEFHESWQIIKNTLQFPDERQLTKGISTTDVPAHLKLLVDSLVWESTRADEGTTGQCLEYLLKNDILGNLVRLSETDRPFGIQALVLRSIANLVVLLDEQFLVHSVVHKAVLRLLRNCVGDQIEEQVDGKAKLMGAASNPKRVSPSEYEEDLVDLLCILCSRIRNFRELLMIFFYDKHWYQTHLQTVVEEEDEDDESLLNSNPSNRSTSPTPSQATITSGNASSTKHKIEYEFLLFNYLLRFVHREGRIGDFARAGLLFLMDVAMSAGDSSDANTADPIADAALALAEYVLDGDFSDVLGAGLGAVYSVLPSKLAVRPEISQSGNGMVIGASSFSSEKDKERKLSEDERDQDLGIEDSSTVDFKTRLDHFLKLLSFLKDVLRLNGTSSTDLVPTSLVGTAVVQSILNAVRSVFLENILYTSILECSDSDGSAVAVMTYIDIMIHTWAGSHLGDMLIEFLMNEDEQDTHGSHSRALDYTKKEKSFIKKLRRKSSAMAFLEMEAPDARRKPSEYITSVGRFTLKDLISANLRSSSSRSVISALYLLQTVLTCHPTVCVDKLLVSVRDPNATNFPQPSRILDVDTSSNVSHDSDDDEVFIYPGEEHIIPPVKLVTLFKEPDLSLPIHDLEMSMYHGLVSRIGSADVQSDHSFSTGYTHYLHDALLLLQSHRAFQESFSSERPSGFSSHHRLDPNDPLLVTVLSCLQDFFRHPPEYNVALTGVLGALALDPYRSLTGWLVFTPPVKTLEEQVLSVDALNSSDDESTDGNYSGDILNSEDYDLRALPLNEALRPVLYSVFYSLISQLDRYRSQIPDFNKYLVERRQGLLFSENLSDALTLALEASSEEKTFNLPTTSQPPPSTPPRPKAKSVGNSLVAFLTPKKKAAPSRMSSLATEASSSQSKVIAASPFGSHYQKTGTISVLPHPAQLPSSGPWSPAKKPTWSTAKEVIADSKQWDEDDDSFAHTFHVQKEVQDASEERITLSQLLDNIVILEESIKELTAIIYARRSLGIDGVRYVQ